MTDAVLQAIQFGLQAVWKLGIMSLVVETDIKKAVSLIKKTCPDDADGIIEGIWSLMDHDWEVPLGHIRCEGNQVADIMANLGAFQDDLFKEWNSPPYFVTYKSAADSLRKGTKTTTKPCRNRNLRKISVGTLQRQEILVRKFRYNHDLEAFNAQGVETTSLILLEWLSYTRRYMPVGLLDVIPQR